MSKRLFISSLTAAFSLGTAFGLAIDEAITRAREASTLTDNQSLTFRKPAANTPDTQSCGPSHQPDKETFPLNHWEPPNGENDDHDFETFPLNKPEAETAPDNDLVCRETSPGQAHCWPKEHAPAPDSDLTCIDSESKTLCVPTPAVKGPKLGL